MPYVFSYKDLRRPNLQEFLCVLDAERCSAVRNNKRCKKTCVIGLPYCWIHLHAVKQLKVGPSTIENAGKGLFAKKSYSDIKEQQYDYNRDEVDEPDDENLVFERGTVVCSYDGEIISQSTLNRRYGVDTNRIKSAPPYAARILGTTNFEDGACRRGSGSIPNHNVAEKNAALVTDTDSPNNKRIYVVAVDDIYDGDEIFVDYGYTDFEVYNDEEVIHSTKYAAKNSKKVRDAKAIKVQERNQIQANENRRVAREARINQGPVRRSTRRG